MNDLLDLAELDYAFAGVTCVAADTGRVLLLRRSSQVDGHPNTWSCPGGAVESEHAPADGPGFYDYVDSEETAEEAALRELVEETGYDGPIEMWALLPGCTSAGSYGELFAHFIASVPVEFEPQLNWENDEYVWAPLDRWPTPLHPGWAMVACQISAIAWQMSGATQWDR